MDFVTLAMAKAYTDSQQLARTETKTFVVPENLEELDLFGEGLLYVRASSEYIDLLTVTEIEATLSAGEKIRVPSNEVLIIDHDGIQELYLNGEHNDGFPDILTTIGQSDIDDGVYVRLHDGLRISALEYNVIHPIDPKYLPGESVLTTISLDEYDIGTVILNMVMQRAEMLNFGPDRAFFTACEVPGAVRLTTSAPGSLVWADNVVRGYVDGECTQVGFSFTLFNQGQLIKADVCLLWDKIIVISTVTIPTASE